MSKNTEAVVVRDAGIIHRALERIVEVNARVTATKAPRCYIITINRKGQIHCVYQQIPEFGIINIDDTPTVVQQAAMTAYREDK